jgi:hypothetical protein
MTELVLDSSATLSWGFADEATPAGDALLREVQGGRRAWMPALWHLEVANAMLYAKKRWRIDAGALEQIAGGAVADVARERAGAESGERAEEGEDEGEPGWT